MDVFSAKQVTLLVLVSEAGTKNDTRKGTQNWELYLTFL
jgi:hypothetical protein